MKAPKYFVETMQQAIDLHLNAFAMQLMAESFADVPEMFGDETVVFLAHGHPQHKGERCQIRHRHLAECCDSDCWCRTGKPFPPGPSVWFVMTKRMPTAKDFDPAIPTTPAAASAEGDELARGDTSLQEESDV